VYPVAVNVGEEQPIVCILVLRVFSLRVGELDLAGARSL
jgi:hypothetical protein